MEQGDHENPDFDALDEEGEAAREPLTPEEEQELDEAMRRHPSGWLPGASVEHLPAVSDEALHERGQSDKIAPDDNN